MKLIGADASPFVQRVRIVARLKGLDLPLATIPDGGLHGPAFRSINPMARMPALVSDDGWVLAESATIAAYLDETVPGVSLTPTDPGDRARMRWYVQLVDGPLDTGLRAIARSRIMPGSAAPLVKQDSSDVAAFGLTELNDALGALARLAPEPDPWLIGSAPTLADAALFPVLVILDVMRPWNKVHDQIVMPGSLADYKTRLMQEPVFGEAAAALHVSFNHVVQLWALTAA